MKTIGVVGVGVVGNAFYEGMKHAFDVVRYDKRPECSDVDSLLKLAHRVDGPVFVCVPTPMNSDSSASTSIVESVLADLEYAFSFLPEARRTVVIKSTVPPGTCDRLNEQFKSLQVVFNPEFLTEANPVEDFKNQDRIVIGGSPEAAQTVADIYSKAYPGIMQVQCNATTAEMVKYVGNCFLATKISFANEIYQICEKLGISYESVVSTAALDKRLGRSHWKVPGPDGHFGFGLTCFPKDINALIAVARSLGVDPKILQAAWDKNLEVRPERDWENMKGRAVL